MEENKPKLTVSGYRGIWGKDLNEDIAFAYARAFAKILNKQIKFGNEKKKILVGHDSRKSARVILPAIHEALAKENIDMIYAGLLPTPSILLAIKEEKFDGGIIITASHNPIEYNGLKFVMPGGRITNTQEVSEFLIEYQNLSLEEKKYEHTNPPSLNPDNKKFRDMHVNKILENIDANLIRQKKFRVALDPVNSAGAQITKELLKALECEVFTINDNTDIDFAHTPEPLPENLFQIGLATKTNNCDIGFAQDPDADRLVLVNEKGEIVSEELTICLAIESALSKTEKSQNLKYVVVNLSTTRLAEDITNQHQGKIIRSKVGEANVVEKMIDTGATIGGEGSGGVIFPPVGYMRDSLIGIGLILELLARKNQTLSTAVNSYPKYFFKKEKIQIKDNPDKIFEKIKDHFALLADMDYTDGLRLDFSDKSWIQIRTSNTEPILRIFGESPTEKRLVELFEEIHLTLELK